MIYKVNTEGHLHEEESHADGFTFTEYKKIVTDPAHIAAEVSMEVISYLLFGIIFAKIWKRHDRKVHGK